jgi:SWI/SNF-related matrix-associated actin-dependent regulator 1 of chromatin subfamily A
LKERISKYFIRRIKSEILPDLPEKIFINRPVELPVEWQEKYSMAINRFSEFLRKVRGKEKIDIIKSLQAEKLVKLGELRQLTTMGKIDEAEAIIRQTIDDGGKILVFSCYNTPLEILHKKFKNHSVLLIGKTSEEDRREAIDIFQGNEKINIFFGGTQSAGIGITLTAATNVLFIDYSWTPADHAQAIDRIHRPGQKAAYVTIYNLYAKGTIDEYMTKTLERKQILFDRLIEGKQTSKRSTNKSMINDVLRMIEKKAHEELFEKHSA